MKSKKPAPNLVSSEFRARFFGQSRIDREIRIGRDREFAAAFGETRIEVVEMIADGDTAMFRMLRRAGGLK